MGQTYSTPDAFFSDASDGTATLGQCTTSANPDGTERKACTRFRCVQMRGPVDLSTPVFGDQAFDQRHAVTAVPCEALGADVATRIAAAEAAGTLREVTDAGAPAKSTYEYVPDVYGVGTM